MSIRDQLLFYFRYLTGNKLTGTIPGWVSKRIKTVYEIQNYSSYFVSLRKSLYVLINYLKFGMQGFLLQQLHLGKFKLKSY